MVKIHRSRQLREESLSYSYYKHKSPLLKVVLIGCLIVFGLIFTPRTASANQISADGRYVAFPSDGANLAPGCGERHDSSNIYRKDLYTGAIACANTDANNANSWASGGPSISANGRYVAYYVSPDFVDSGDSSVPGCSSGGSGNTYVYRKDLQTGAVVCASTDANGNGENSYDGNGSPTISLSTDGRYVAFSSRGLTSDGCSAYGTQVYRKDLQNGAIICAGTDANGIGANNYGADGSSMTPDGRYMTFSSNATNLMPNCTPAPRSNVYRKDLQDGTIICVGADINGAAADNITFDSAISTDGRYIAFASQATNLAPECQGKFGFAHVYRKDTQAGAAVCITTSASGVAADQAVDTGEPSISSDGRYIVFSSDANNLVPGCGATGGASGNQIYRKDSQTNAIVCVSTNANGTLGNYWSYSPSISADGRYITFGSGASNLVPNCSGGIWGGGVYRKDLQTGEIVCVVNATGTSPNPDLVPVNSVTPTINGTPIPGQLLSCSRGNWDNNPTNYSYQWNVDNTDIVDATSADYLILDNDVGHRISCTVTATNSSGSSIAKSDSVLITINSSFPARSANTDEKKFAPILLFDSSENYFPLNIDNFLINGSVDTCVPPNNQWPGPNHRVCTSISSPEIGDYYNQEYLAYDKNFLVNQQDPEGKTYAIQEEKNINNILSYKLLHYRWFYSYDTGWQDIDAHHGDWEGIDVLVEVTKDINGKLIEEFPIGAFYHQHSEQHYKLFTDLLCNGTTNTFCIDRGQTHPNIFVSKGKHASYPTNCSNPTPVSVSCHHEGFPFVDNGYDGGKAWAHNNDSNSVTNLEMTDEEKNTFPGDWTLWPGSWSEDGDIIGPWVNPSPSIDSIKPHTTQQSLETNNNFSLDNCQNWNDEDILASYCDSAAISKTWSQGLWKTSGEIKISLNRKTGHGEVPGLTQVVGKPLQITEKLKITGLTTPSGVITVRGSMRKTVIEATFRNTNPVRGTAKIQLGTNKRGQPTLTGVNSRGKKLKPKTQKRTNLTPPNPPRHVRVIKKKDKLLIQFQSGNTVLVLIQDSSNKTLLQKKVSGGKKTKKMRINNPKNSRNISLIAMSQDKIPAKPKTILIK